MAQADATPAIDPERLDALILAHIAIKAKPPSPSDLAKALRRFAPATETSAQWKAFVVERVDRLQRAGAIDKRRNVADKAAAWRALGLARSVPWKRLVGVELPARALAAEPGSGKTPWHSDRDKLVAAIAARVLDLWKDKTPPTLPAVGNEVVWHSLGIKGKAKQVADEIRCVYAARTLKIERPTFAAALLAFAVEETGAVRPDVTALRAALVRRWLTHTDAWQLRAITTGVAVAPTPVSQPVDPPRPPPPPPPPVDLASFAAAVQAAAAAETSAVFGPRKVFIIAVWQRLRGTPAAHGLDLDGFKRRLAEAHHAGLLVLARADLVGAMDPALVAASEASHLEATYHFVTRKEPA